MQGDQPGPPPPSSAAPAPHETRWLGEGYADITKLRELSARHERRAAKIQSRIARLHTKIEKLRHGATILREKAGKVLSRVPEYEQEMAQHERDIQAAIGHQPASTQTIGSDITALHYRIRQLQQKIVDLQHRARRIEHRAAIKTQQSAVLKVKADRLNEQVQAEQREAQNYRKRADRLQLTTEGDAAPAAAPPAGPPPGPPVLDGDDAGEHDHL